MIDNMQLSKENSTIIVYDRFNSLVSIVSILFLCISYFLCFFCAYWFGIDFHIYYWYTISEVMD